MSFTNKRSSEIENDKTQKMNKNNIQNTAAKVLSCEFTLRIILENKEHNFVDINWIKVCDFLNSTTPNWSFLAFGSQHRNLLINGADEESVRKLEAVKEIVVDKKAFPVIVEQLKVSSRKGIIYSRFLSTLKEDQIESALRECNVAQFYRLQKFDVNNQRKIFTGTIILDFDSDIPSHITIAKIKIPVNHLAPKPMICFHCGILGHTVARCQKKSINFCQSCYFVHSEHSDCNLHCKQCQGAHISTDPSCEIIIRELQILKIKDLHGLNYFDAKTVSESLNLPVVLDPLDSARLKIQELLQKNEFLFSAGRLQVFDNHKLTKQLDESIERIQTLERINASQKSEHLEEMDNFHKEMVNLQTKYQETVNEGAKSILQLEGYMAKQKVLEEKIKISEDKQRVLEERIDISEQSVLRLNTDKINDGNQINEFLNSHDSIGRAYLSFVKQTSSTISLDIKVARRNNSSERSKIVHNK